MCGSYLMQRYISGSKDVPLNAERGWNSWEYLMISTQWTNKLF